MVEALEHDERVGRSFKIAPLRVGAGEMDLEHAEPRAGRIEDEGSRIGDKPLGAAADEEAEHAIPDQRVQFGQVLVSMERGFVQGGLVGFFMWAKSSCGPSRSERERIESPAGDFACGTFYLQCVFCL